MAINRTEGHHIEFIHHVETQVKEVQSKTRNHIGLARAREADPRQ